MFNINKGQLGKNAKNDYRSKRSNLKATINVAEEVISNTKGCPTSVQNAKLKIIGGKNESHWRLC